MTIIKNRKANRLIRKNLYYIGLIIVIFVVIFPFMWMVLASFKTQKDILSVSKLINFVPTLKNYKTVLVEYSFSKPIFNSFVIAFFSTILSLVLGLPASYSISKYKLTKLSMVILITRITPGLTFLVPWFIIFTKFKLVDTYTSLILTHMLVALPFIIWIMVPFFDGLPSQLEQAARVDGCTRMGAFVRIMLPLSKSGIITSGILSFIFSWNNFMFALILAGAKTKTLPIAIFNFISYAEINWGGLMAAAVIITGPIILISLVLQKYIIKGLTAGAVKG